MKKPLYSTVLTSLPLNSSEAHIYELLLELGPQPAQTLTEHSGIGRGNVYNALKSLQDKNLVREEKGKKNLFKAASPELLREMSNNEIAKAQSVSNQLESILPALKSHFNLITKQPTIRIFEGFDGIKELYLALLEEQQPIYSLVSTDAPEARVYKWLTTTYVKKRVQANIKVFGVTTGNKSETLEKNSTKELRQLCHVDKQLYPFAGEVNVVGDTVAFINYKEKELIGFIIESPSLAQTLRSVVQLLFATLPN